VTIDGDSVGGIIKFKEAKRRSAEANAPGRKKNCSPKYPCYGRGTVVISDDSGVCDDVSFDFTPQVQSRHAPLVPLIVSAILGPVTRVSTYRGALCCVMLI
jgi:hypothetical protein